MPEDDGPLRHIVFEELSMVAAETKSNDATPAGWSVIALLLKEFSRQAVAEQARLKSQLEALVAIAVQPLSPEGRIVLDAPEGLVVVVLANPNEALAVAERAQAGAADLPVCLAVNYGPVKAMKDASGAPRLVGDGILSAVTLANLATRGRMLLSRPFREAVVRIAPHRARTLVSVGAFTDATVRSHELFTIDPRAAILSRRRLIAGGGLAVLGIVGAGIAVRVMRERPAVIQFEISPRGDIFVDGVMKGRSPPVNRIEVSPGSHTIEVRNEPHAPLKLEMRLRSAEEVRVSHAFGTRRAERKEGDSFVEDIRRRLGF